MEKFKFFKVGSKLNCDDIIVNLIIIVGCPRTEENWMRSIIHNTTSRSASDLRTTLTRLKGVEPREAINTVGGSFLKEVYLPPPH